MKKILVSVLLMVAVGLTTALAGDETGISKQVKENFEKEFAGARSVVWNNLGDYQVATFIFEDVRVEAYFNSETGDLEGAARYILFDQMPLLVLRAFNKNFASTDLLNALEISNTEGVSYLLVAEKENKRYRIKISANGNVLSKTKIKQ